MPAPSFNNNNNNNSSNNTTTIIDCSIPQQTAICVLSPWGQRYLYNTTHPILDLQLLSMWIKCQIMLGQYQ